jgi:hypothetical protein
LGNEIESYKKLLDDIRTKYIRLERNPAQKALTPTFHWAQQRAYVIMEVIFSNGQETCKDFEVEHIDLYSSGLELIGRCVQEALPYQFKLKLNFWDDIVRLNSLYNYENGKYTFMLKKKSYVKWVSLTKENIGPIWKEMQDKYDEDEKKNLDDIEDEEEDEDEDDIEEIKKKKKRRPDYELGINRSKNYRKGSYWD